jgi:hypothetical protein
VPGGRCADAQAQFSRATISVDVSKQMSALTDAERTAVCAELSRALTASFGTAENACKLGSHSGTREGMPTCQAWYDDCLQAPPQGMISGCTDNMSGMWSCPITIGQYKNCFNDVNSMLLALIVTAPACAVLDETICGPIQQSAACAAAPCDYVWFD